ncbi:hypothetical protein HPB52_017425 [Rhipicephalus sanguineus]|uniref:Ig-like domain-containing protein n=1 Tax=Rhipicephalus sanguineus TaxID=34632 RepID=A0A9D4SWI4_RHISA|nr:hypothetical protein HPB52_017425 [Rhipicephalus sanguineus]
MVLPEEPLFFQQVQHSRREQDTGIYWCTATNQMGTARSRNASVEIAVLDLQWWLIGELLGNAGPRTPITGHF